ncbi:RagB/SusD family nutrient uptake outer membrane protein [Rhabdobacter roseus]|uniref:RagB/SusD family nutrient uptake outer membrane protein n=1 Tax=Rhabdobacter roseus TaxID=1655419 RepID=A0A840TWS7_9BACT|nr:RagB/SusD family nutrient uptake outer membrane protein [Rhabdobacter roseus]MBB5287385.1 hypothetical protein [Rhabdobacter roseus]
MKKNMHTFYRKMALALLLVSTLGINACQELDENVYSEITTANFYETKDQVMAAYLLPYGYMQEVVYDIHWSLATFPTDEAVATVKNGQGYENGRWIQFHQHTWTTSLDFILWEWFNVMRGIGFCNQFIAEIESRDLSAMDLPLSKEQMLAEMKLLRAQFYYFAIDMFGNVPIVTTVGEANPTTRPRAEVFAFIESEILANINLLGEKGDHGWYGHFTKTAAHALLARLYINAEVFAGTPRWDDAIASCDYIINSGHYTLDATWDAPFKVRNENSQENILVVPYDYNYATGFNMGMQNLPGAMRDAYGIPGWPWGKTVTQESFFRLFKENDLRINQWLVGPQSYLDASGNQQPVWGWWDQDGEQLVIRPQIALLNNPNGGYGDGVRNIKYEIERGMQDNMSNDFVMYRLSEILFLKAEALMRKNGGTATQEAVTLINQVRRRAFAPGDPDATYTTATLTLNELLNERGREFAYEMKRREDLIRFGKFGEPWWEKPASAKTRELYPIPMQIRVANPLLEQNPGY